MNINRKIATKPGVIVKDYIKSMGITQTEFAARMGANVRRLGDIITGHRKINANTAMMLASAANDPLRDARYWMGVQSAYDLALAAQEKEVAA